MPMFRNAVSFSKLSRYLLDYEDGIDSVPKHWHLNYKLWGITQKKAYEIEILSVFYMILYHFVPCLVLNP
jgi:hypothetical protein